MRKGFNGLFVLIALAAACGGAASSNGVSGSPESGDDDDTSASDGGGSDDPDSGEGDDPSVYDTEAVCTSKKTWTRGDHGSSSMHPGGTCVSCHEDKDGPTLTVGGTVYPTAHEPDDCNGTNAGSLKVVITDANKKTTTLLVNSVGNFYSAATIKPPFTAKVVSGTKERVMTTPQKSGDCNSCHTETGTEDAPGRIMAP